MIRRKIALVLFRPDFPRFDILNSYNEVMESLLWGFEALGYDCSIRTNAIDSSAVNIVFGWELLYQMGNIDALPTGSILYNLEQYSGYDLKNTEKFTTVARRFQIWDYSLGNIRKWDELNPKFPPFYARVSYAPNLRKVLKLEIEDIDVLYYGSLGAKRSEKVSTIANSSNSWSVVTLTNVWGKMRDEFISRARLLVNVSHQKPHMNIFEVVRVSYLLANEKAVICETVAGLEVEDDLKAVLKMVPADQLADVCSALLQNTAEKDDYAKVCSEVFRSRDVRDLIKDFIATAAHSRIQN